MTAIYVNEYINQMAQFESAVYATARADLQEDSLQNDIDNAVDLDEIISSVLQYECVTGARAFEWDGNIVVAVLTVPFYLKSERDSTREMIENELNELNHKCNITVSFDVHVYRNIRKNMSEDDIKKLYELVFNR